MKRKLLSLLFVIAIGSSALAADIQIGTGGTTDQSLPVNPYYGYSYSQVIYLASEINGSGTITRLKWYFDGYSLEHSNNWTIYLGHTSRTAFSSSTDWVPLDSLTQVFSGTVSCNGSGWITVDISGFTYNGTNNLVVAVDENTPSYDDEDDQFYSTQKSTNRAIEFHDDNTNPDPASPPAGNVKPWIANIIIHGIALFCPPPTFYPVGEITDTSAVLSWEPGGSETTWDILYGAPGFDPDSGTIVTGITSNPYTLNGLYPGTDYECYIRADCSDHTSPWAGPSTFITANSVPWHEGFENMPSVGYHVLPEGMVQSGNWSTAKAPDSYHRAARTGTNYVYAYNYPQHNQWLITQGIQLTAGVSYDFSFWYVTDGQSGWTTLEAKCGTGQTPADMTTTVGTPVQNVINTTYAEYRGSFVPTTSGTYYFSIHFSANVHPFYITFDDLSCEVTPDCASPNIQTVDNITSNSADLGWTPAGDESAWDIKYGNAGMPPDSGTIITGVTTNPYTLTGLNEGTSYDWYIRSQCDGGGHGNWEGPQTFLTHESPPWNEGFENMTNVGNGIVPPGMAEDGDWTTDDEPGTDNRHAKTGTHYIFTNRSADDWIFSPAIELTGGITYDFSFWYVTGGAAPWTVVEAKYGTGQTAADMSEAIGVPDSNVTNTNYVEYLASFTPQTSGVYYIGIHVVSDWQTRYMSFDDLSLEETPSCPRPAAQTVSNITDTSVDLGWTPRGSETTWDIKWGSGRVPA